MNMHVIFLPGAGGAASFWHRLGKLFPDNWRKTYLSWPGLGDQPHDPSINSIDDLVTLAEKEITGPVVLVAQSMGGSVAVRLALRQQGKVTHLVLAATSGGVDVAGFGGADWRDSYRNSFPHAAHWITEVRPDHSNDLPHIACPTLLLWGDNDPISPVAVGEHLAALIPQARLCVVEGGDHDLGRERARDIAPLIMEHVGQAA